MSSELVSYPHLHADDFGLTLSINSAISDLYTLGKLDGASLLVNSPFLLSALDWWKNNQGLSLCLHLCLTEGIPISEKKHVKDLINNQGILDQSFFRLFIISFLPKSNLLRKRIEDQLRFEIHSQIHKFKKLTNLKSICIDGHQHIHLIPLVLNILLEISREEDIAWIRTLDEPFDLSFSLKKLLLIFSGNRWIKWILMKILTLYAKKRIKAFSISTNQAFAGILFTGRMTNNILKSSFIKLQNILINNNNTRPLLLIHPSKPSNLDFNLKKYLLHFPISQDFVSSIWREREFISLRNQNI